MVRNNWRIYSKLPHISAEIQVTKLNSNFICDTMVRLSSNQAIIIVMYDVVYLPDLKGDLLQHYEVGTILYRTAPN